jgi:parallel beta-helix repeat protein
MSKERHRTAGAVIGLVLVLMVGSVACLPIRPITGIGAVEEGSDRIGCGRADNRIEVTVSSHLDPSCTYTRSIQITSSDVVFDCRGAMLDKAPDSRDRLGIEIVAPIDVPLSNVTIRNCIVRGFSNNVRIRREGFRDLTPGSEYDSAFSNIRIENSHFYDSEASGLFVDAYVTGVTLDGIEVARSGGVGIYLEGGSRDNVVQNSEIHHNGFGDVDPEGVPVVVGGVEFRYRSTGREGIAIDGSRNNVLRGNRIHNNAAGAVFLYKNCGEDVTTNPGGWWNRPYGSSGNLIEANVMAKEDNGVWLGSRMAENQALMDCSDVPYVTGPLRAIYLDPAPDNIVRGNMVLDVVQGVRVEDDGNRVEDNLFVVTDQQTAVLIGTRERTAALGQPVSNTIVTGNEALSTVPIEPYRWAYGQTGTTFAENLANELPAALIEGTPPPINPFLFAEEIWVAP